MGKKGVEPIHLLMVALLAIVIAFIAFYFIMYGKSSLENVNKTIFESIVS